MHEPIPSYAHGLAGYGIGAALLAAPAVFDMEEGTAQTVSQAIETGILGQAVITDHELGIAPKLSRAGTGEPADVGGQ